MAGWVSQHAPKLPVGIKVTGSNGKGSTAALIAAALRAHDLRCGLFTSPHLWDPCERVRIDDNLIDEASLERWLDRVPTAGRSAFEVWTCIAAGWFAEQQVDTVVWEAGLGGRLDPTRVMPSACTVLTQVALEHTAILGNTPLEIAREKEALRDPGTPLIIGPVHPSVRLALAPPVLDGWPITVPCGLPGAHQRENARLALTAAHQLLGADFVPDRAIQAIAAAHWPARFERVATDPDVWVDVAHDASALAQTVLTAREVLHDRPVVLLIGISNDRPRETMVPIATAIATEVVATRAQKRGTPAALIAAACPMPCVAIDDLSEALHVARERAKALDGVVLACGGLFLGAELTELVRSQS